MNKFVTLLALTLAACGIDTSQQLSARWSQTLRLETWAAEVESAVAHWHTRYRTCCAFRSRWRTGSPITLVVVSALRTHVQGRLPEMTNATFRRSTSVMTCPHSSGTVSSCTNSGNAIGLGHWRNLSRLCAAPSYGVAPSASDVMRARKVLRLT